MVLTYLFLLKKKKLPKKQKTFLSLIGLIFSKVQNFGKDDVKINSLIAIHLFKFVSIIKFCKAGSLPQATNATRT